MNKSFYKLKRLNGSQHQISTMNSSEYFKEEVVDENTMKIISLNIKEGNKRICDKQDKGILLMGKTQSGKSTLIYILNNKVLKAKYQDDEGRWIIQPEEQLDTVVIGQKCQSETQIPNKVFNKDHQVTIRDCPGSQDTSGIVAEISNRFYIQRILTTTESIKLIMVCVEAALAHTCQSFIESLIQIVMSFQDISSLNQSVSLIVTQCPLNPKKTTIEQIKNRIQNNVLVNLEKGNYTPEQKQKSKQILQFFQKCIYVFHIPQCDNFDTYIYESDLLNKIENNTKYVKYPSENVNLSISAGAQFYAEKLFDITQKQFQNSLQQGAQLIISESKLINAIEYIVKQQPKREWYNGILIKRRKTVQNFEHQKLLNNQDIVQFHQNIKFEIENQFTFDQPCQYINQTFELLIIRTNNKEKQAQLSNKKYDEVHLISMQKQQSQS